MSTKITTVYNALLSKISAHFPNKTRIPNSYNLEENKRNFLVDGWGIKKSESIPAPSEFCNFSQDYDFSVVLTREVVRMDSATSPTDTTVLALCEDIVTLQKDFLGPNQLDIEESLTYVTLGSVSPVEEFYNNKNSFLTLEASFIINIIEDIN